MLHVKIIAVGKIRDMYLKAGIQEYVKRLQAYVYLDVVEIADQSIPDKASPALCARIKGQESEKILLTLTDQEFVVLLDRSGKQVASEELAAFIEKEALCGTSRLTFIIGGSLGVDDKVRRRANWCWSFSTLTFPHQLMRLMLLEQIYRACKIRAREVYHK